MVHMATFNMYSSGLRQVGSCLLRPWSYSSMLRRSPYFARAHIELAGERRGVVTGEWACCSCFIDIGASNRTRRRQPSTRPTLCCGQSMSTVGIQTSPYPDVHIPEVSITDYVMEKFTEYGDRTAVVDAATTSSYTFTQLRDVSRQIASALARKGLNRGDHFAICSTNSTEYVSMFFGIIMAGGIVTTMNPAYTPDELAYQLSNSRARYIITIPSLVDRVMKAREQAPFLEEIYVFGEAEGATPFSSLLNDDGSAFPQLTVNALEDVAVLPYSSGTTGIPKGVMLTHYNLVANQCQINKHLNTYKCSDPLKKANTLCLLPIFHIFGMTAVLMSSLYQGTNVITIPRFDPELFLKTIQDYKITHLPVVPPVVLFMATHPIVDKYDLSSVEVMKCGAAPLRDTLIEKVQKRLNIDFIKQGYGLTETSPVTHIAHRDDNLPSSTGKIIPNTEAKIVDVVTGESLPAHKDGELLIRGPQVMKGYWQNEEATKECIDADRFFHTGDIARYDDDGNYYIVDRLKELIKVKGYQVAPAELEAICLCHPQIADVAVIGIPEEGIGELPKAFVVRRSDSLTEKDVMEFVENQVAPFKKLQGGVEFIDEIPRSPSGKILRRLVKQTAPKN